MMKCKKCKNCGKEFIKKDKGRKYRNYMFCSSKCYWEYHLKDILKKEEDKALGGEDNEFKNICKND